MLPRKRLRASIVKFQMKLPGFSLIFHMCSLSSAECSAKPTDSGPVPYLYTGQRWHDWRGSWNKKYDLHQQIEKMPPL
jgi:hypothetical protein